VRGVKVGLPLIECFKIVAREARSPVKEQFQIIVEDQLVDMPLAEATERLPERVPVAEARFFSIVISIQSRSGGSLAETLGNLSKVLRDRQKMFDKIKALSSESKASAYIIAALPVVVVAALSVVSPAYIALLFTEQTGHISRRLRAVDDRRHPGHAQNDQFRLLRHPCRSASPTPTLTCSSPPRRRSPAFCRLFWSAGRI
jgi:tight adherence protein B